MGMRTVVTILEALAVLLKKRREARLTAAMNRALERIDQISDGGLREAGRRAFQRSEWN